jgi:LmbE family N-acetylglucosaminyl deacetylase
MTVSDVLTAMRDLPMMDLDDIAGPSTTLILAPHQDDESLGCGGLIAEGCARGRPPFVIFVTDGTGSHSSSVSYPSQRLRATRESEALAAVRALGLSADRVRFLRLPDTKAPHSGPAFDWAVETIGVTARRLGCCSIAAPWQHDPHCDHLASHQMAVAAASRCGIRHIAYPVWGWTLPGDDALEQRVLGGRLDIAIHLPAKRRAIAAHASQHGHLITDDPNGFVLPRDLLGIFDKPYECFLW